jgi:signal transduction histidine kinase
VAVFAYAVVVIALGLWELGQRGLHSRSLATQRRVRFLVITGAFAGLFSLIDFVWVIGYEPAYYPAPVGVVLSVVFLFMIAQALRHERLLDLYEMLARTLVATATAFLIGFVFYVMVTVVGQFNTMWLNAIVGAIVVLVLFNPLHGWVERMMQGLYRERRKLEESVAVARRRLAHTLELEELGGVVMTALERSSGIDTAALYALTEDGATFEQLGALGSKAPKRIEVATASALLGELAHRTVLLEELLRAARDGHTRTEAGTPIDSLLAAAEVLGELRSRAVVIAIHSEAKELVGLLVVADQRIDDAFSPEDVGLLESLAAQIGVVIENSKRYARMKERDRLAVLGQMAAGLAHEIRNPLGAIKGAAQLMAEPVHGAAHDPASREFLGIILEEVERLNDVVGSVLDLARDNTGAVPPIDVNAVVRRTLQVMSAERTDDRLELETDLEDELPRTAIAPDQLRQILMNLLKNAVQAMKGKGRITVQTRLRPGSSGRLGARTSADSGWVVLSVRDEGPGIAPAQMKNIFMPFFTTKEDGTGLGLAICQRIVQSAGGRIDVRSREGEGTTFDVVLPASMEALGTPTPVPAELALPRGGQ